MSFCLVLDAHNLLGEALGPVVGPRGVDPATARPVGIVGGRPQAPSTPVVILGLFLLLFENSKKKKKKLYFFLTASRLP